MTKAIRSYKDLIVYQKAYQLVLQIDKVTESFPKTEIYGLVSQMRRSAVSIPANIAEGYRRGHRKEYIQFLRIAQGSCGELETFLSISKDLDFIKEKEFEEFEKVQEEISRLLQALISSLTVK